MTTETETEVQPTKQNRHVVIAINHLTVRREGLLAARTKINAN